MSLEALATYLADFPYRACPPLGWWQMWGGGHSLDDTMQEMRMAAGQLPEDEFVALMTAIKSRWHSVHERGDDDGGGDGGQPTAE
jgi:hypothetical protein